MGAVRSRSGTLGHEHRLEGGAAAAATALERSRRRKPAGKVWKQCSVLAQLLSARPEVILRGWKSWRTSRCLKNSEEVDAGAITLGFSALNRP